MKALLLLLLIASSAWADLTPNTLALYYFELNGNDQSANGYHLTDNGTITFASNIAAPQGTYAVSTFTTTAFYDTPSGLYNALTQTGSFTIEMYAFKYERFPNTYLVSGGNTSPLDVVRVTLQFGDAVGDTITFRAGGNTLIYEPVDDLRMRWNYIAVTGSPSGMSIYLGDTATAAVLVASNGSNGSIAGDMDRMKIGQFYNVATSGLIALDSLRFSDVARTSFPTTDPSNPTRAPSLNNVLKLKLGWLFNLLATNLYAHTEDQIYESRKDTLNFEAEADRVALLSATPTRTPTPKPEGYQSPTPTRTITPTSTPTPGE